MPTRGNAKNPAWFDRRRRRWCRGWRNLAPTHFQAHGPLHAGPVRDWRPQSDGRAPWCVTDPAVPASNPSARARPTPPGRFPEQRPTRAPFDEGTCTRQLRRPRGGRETVKLERHLGCDPEETLTHAAHEVRRYPNATRGNIVVRLSPRLRHLGMRANQGSPQFTSTRCLPGHSGGWRRVFIAATRPRCVEFVRQSEMSRSSGGSGLLLGLSALRGPTGLDQPAFSARPGYSPVRRPTGALRLRVQYFLGLAGQHHGVRADQ